MLMMRVHRMSHVDVISIMIIFEIILILNDAVSVMIPETAVQLINRANCEKYLKNSPHINFIRMNRIIIIRQRVFCSSHHQNSRHEA
jgi:hypothetical protein